MNNGRTLHLNSENKEPYENHSKDKAADKQIDVEKETKEESPKQNGLPVDRGWAWVILFASWCNCLLSIGSYKAFGVLFIEIQAKYGSSSSMTSLIASCLNGTYSFTALIVTTVGLRYFSSRQFIVLGGLIISAAYILSAFAPTVEILILLLGCVSGIAHGMITAPTMTLISQYFEKYRSLANCIATTGASVGSLIFSVLIPHWIDVYAFSGTVLLLGGVMLQMTISGLLMRPTTFYTKDTTNTDKERDTDEAQNDNKIICEIDEQKTNGALKYTKHADKLSKVLKSETRNGSHLELQNGHNIKGASSPLIDAKYSPVSLRIAAARNRRKRTISELSKTSLAHTMGSAVSALNKSSIGRYASTELSFSSMLDLSSKTQQEHKEKHSENKQTCACFKRVCSKFGSVIDCGPMKRIPFLFFIPCGCFIIMVSAIGLYLPAYAKDLGISSKKCGLLITIISVTDMCAAIFWGVFADKQYIRRHKILSFAVVTMGFATCFTPLFKTYTACVVYSVIYGIFGRVYFSLYPVILVDFIGLENLRSALGIFGLAQTATSAGLQPVIGVMRDHFESYSPGMLLISTMIMIGGLWILTLPFAEKYEQRRNRQNIQEKDMEP
ncbi:monocarboxylate transporter 14-like [Mercenaria mercenaria]|uniref:monocarboxylate transporter 14-like n=1 Tax=Mercenaria mercenaria TaxID=6596 RepID=UPI00234FB57B|nr:monocarboxylate transporter 14-like [Mercenaria mercenaria]